MTLLLRAFALIALVFLAACGTKPAVWAPDEAVQAARYRHPGPTEIMLFNVINNETGGGEHAALMINASQRVLFDPAGSWTHPGAPERHDVHFGFDDQQLFRYTYYHARRTHHVLRQRMVVSPEVAETIFRLAQQAGPVPDAYCARSIATILRQIPGFESLPVSFYPNRLSAAFAELPGVTEERIYSDASPTEAQQYTQ